MEKTLTLMFKTCHVDCSNDGAAYMYSRPPSGESDHQFDNGQVVRQRKADMLHDQGIPEHGQQGLHFVFGLRRM